MHSSKKGSTFKKSSRIFFFKSEEFSGCLSELGQSEMNSPDLLFVLEAILSNKLQLMIDSFLLKGSSRSLECGGVYDKSRYYSSCSFFPSIINNGLLILNINYSKDPKILTLNDSFLPLNSFNFSLFVNLFDL